jgi:hypothetical protein
MLITRLGACLRCGLAAIALIGSTTRCVPRPPDGSASHDAAGNDAATGVHNTFATTFDPNPRYACGYMREMVDEFLAAPGKDLPAGGMYFVAISADNYHASSCGRLIDITVHAQCGNGSDIDEGYCEPETVKLERKIQAILVDRCADAKKCMPPSRHNQQLGHEVSYHLDLGPAAVARASLGDKANYDITWRFSEETYRPRAYVVGSENPDYIRIGLMTSAGAQKLRVGTGEYTPNGTQAEFGFYSPGVRDKLRAGMTIEVLHQTGATSLYTIQSPLDEATALKHMTETIYRARLDAASKAGGP